MFIESLYNYSVLFTILQFSLLRIRNKGIIFVNHLNFMCALYFHQIMLVKFTSYSLIVLLKLENIGTFRQLSTMFENCVNCLDCVLVKKKKSKNINALY